MTHSGFRVRAARADDLADVLRLVAQASLPIDGVEDQFGDGYAIAECPAGLIGVEGIERYGSAALLRSAAVDSAWRGKGVGEALTRDRLQWAATHGVREVWLLTNTAAAYFPRFGFEPADRASAPSLVRQSREFSETCCASAVAMRLVLSN
ncbi:MAG: GNAT family N-acetyltransferase [Gemmatimonadaceae bacterium]|nr:GNAT family N-acetyltransferase [Gemmatimonadaceae bacterium]